MEEELKEIVRELDKLREEHNCRIDITCLEYQMLGEIKKRFFYKAIAVKPEEEICEVGGTQ